MIGVYGSAGRREMLAGLALGVYATCVALTPGIPGKAALCVPLIAVPLGWRILKTPNYWLALFLASALLLPPLPIKLGDSGPHIALLFAAAGLWIGVLRLPEWRFQADALTTSLLILGGIMLSSVGMALLYSGGIIAAGSFARVLLFGISVFIFLYVRHGPGRIDSSQGFRWIRLLFWGGMISALFACVDFYFQFPAPAGFEEQFVWLDTGVFRRAQGVFYEASTLGNICAFFLEMCAVALFRPRGDRPFPPFALALGGVTFAAALVLSYSRGSLVNVAVAGAVLLWFYRDRIAWRRLMLSVGILGTAGAAILGLAFPLFAQAYWIRLTSIAQFFSESPDMVLSGRVRSWELIGQFLISNPLHALLGVGYKTLPYSDFIGTTSVGDNTYLSLLTETGIAGLLAVIALNVAILAVAYKAARSSDKLRSFCGTCMLCFWAGQAVQMFSADLLTYWRVLPIYFFVLALAARPEA
jgi:O-antigen ligase